jgi:hypothetical protein
LRLALRLREIVVKAARLQASADRDFSVQLSKPDKRYIPKAQISACRTAIASAANMILFCGKFDPKMYRLGKRIA